jgi:hypothetical protein
MLKSLGFPALFTKDMTKGREWWRVALPKETVRQSVEISKPTVSKMKRGLTDAWNSPEGEITRVMSITERSETSENVAFRCALGTVTRSAVT